MAFHMTRPAVNVNKRSLAIGRRVRQPCLNHIPTACWLSVPRIDEVDTEVIEMTGVAGGEEGLARDGNAGDLDVANFDRSAALRLLSSECRRGFGSFSVEWQHSAAENLADGQIEGLIKSLAPAAWRQNRQAEMNFEDCNRRRPD